MLTIKGIAKLTAPGRYRDKETRGLYLQVGRSGTKSWLFRFELNGRERFHGLGSLDDFTLKEARERARKARQLLADGRDPIEEKKAAKATSALANAKTFTFEQAARQYYEQHEQKWRNAKHRAQVLSTLAMYAFPKIGKLSVADIDTGLVLKVLEPIWQDKTETASRVRGRIEAVLDWSTVRGYRWGENPARWKGHLSEVLPAPNSIAKPAHHAALPFADLPELVHALAQREGVAARALEFTILTAARTGETIGATWSEFDLKAKTWTVPANRIKGGKEHRVPLTDRVLEILADLPREDGNSYVFIGASKGSGLSNMSMAAVLKRMGRDDVTVHGFRSTFRDWCAERTNYQNHIVEMALAHVVGNKVEAAYRRGDLLEKRRNLMDAWTKFVTSPVPVTGEVVPLRRNA